jgi:hypothetical protein
VAKNIGRELLSEDALAQLFWNSAAKSIEAEVKESGAAENLRSGLETALRYIKEMRVQKLHADISMLSKISGEDVVWTETDWLPRCRAAGLKYVAVVVPKSMASYLALEKMTVSAGPDGGGFNRRFFGDPEEARKWLSQQ